jgi:hypothetical protein
MTNMKKRQSYSSSNKWQVDEPKKSAGAVKDILQVPSLQLVLVCMELKKLKQLDFCLVLKLILFVEARRLAGMTLSPVA